MKDEEKTREELLFELESLRREFAESKKAESECRWIEAALKESEERYRRLVESITDYIYTVKIENDRPVSTTHGPGCLAVTGYTSEHFQMYPHLWYEMIHEEDRKTVLKQVEKIFSGETVQPLEHRIIHKDGSIRWVRNTPVPHFDKKGGLIAYDGIIEDITERRMASEALSESEEKFRAIAAGANDAIIMMDDETNISYWNLAAEKIFGYLKEEAIGKRLHELIVSTGNHGGFSKGFERFQESGEGPVIGKTLELGGIRKDGTEFYAEHSISAVKIKGKWNAIGIVRDVSDRKNAEEALRASQEYAKGIIESSMDMIIAVDKDRRITEFNKAAQETFGYTLEEVLGKHIDILYTDPSEGLKVHEVTLENGRHLQEIVNRRKNGELFPSLLSSSVLRNAQGDIVGLMGVSHDITRRKRDEEALKESFAKIERAKRDWEATFDAIADPVFIHDNEFRITRTNRAYAEAAGLPFDEIIGRLYFEVFPRTEGPFTVCKETLISQKMEEEEISVSSINKIFRVRYYPVKDANGNYLHSIHIMEDITEQRRAEEKIKKLSQSVEQSPSIVMITDVKGNIEYVNPKFTEITDYTSEEIIGLNAGDLGTQSQEEYRQMWDTITSGKVWRGIFHNVKKGGEYFWESASISAVRNQGGIITNFIKVAEDITERKKTEERQKALYEFSQRIVSSLDLDFRLRSVCQAIFEMGYKMAWLGTLKEDTKDIIPIAQAGFEDGYLSSIKIKFDDSPLGQGPTGRAIKKKRPEVQDHITTDPRYEPWKKAALEREYRSSGAFPIIDRDKVIAVLNIYHTGDEFPKRDVDFLQTFANQTASYIRNAQLFGEAKETADRLTQEMEVTSHLLMISEATAHTTDIDKLMEQVVHCSHEIVKCDICLSYLWDSETKSFRPSQAVGLPHNLIPLFKTESLDMKVGFVKEAMRKKAPIVKEIEAVHELPLQWIEDIHAFAAIPLIGRKGPLGLIMGIYVETPRRGVSTGFSERDIKVMKGISHQVSTALEEARFYKESVDKAMELSHRIETIKAMHEIDRSILSTIDSHELLETITRLVARIIPCDRATVVNVDREKRMFSWGAGFGTQFLEGLGSASFEDTSTGEILETGRTEYIADIRDIKDPLPIEKGLIKEGFLSHIRVPLKAKGEIVGILSVGAKRPSAFTPENFSTLEYLGAQVGVALENARLVSDLEELFLGTVKSLSSAIDAKSPWTAGHSERVTKYALDIAKEMGLGRDEMRSLELAGLLHDIGKIGTYDFLLDKPGKLEPDEVEIVRLHPVKGASILEPIKKFRDIIPAIKHHHEYFSGNGYPDKLKGENIPLFARILSVADTYDAMKADRPYRPGRTIEYILEEFKKCSGTQFDPTVVEAFLKTIGGIEEFKMAAS